MTKRLDKPMSLSERGIKGGTISGRTRMRQANQRARDNALAALEANTAGLAVAPQLAAWVRSGVLDAWILGIDASAYHRGLRARWAARKRREDAAAKEATAA